MLKSEEKNIIDQFPLKSIDEAFAYFASLISDEKNNINHGEAISHLAYQIDVYALATILNFFNRNVEMTKKLEQANLLIIRMYALVTSEIVKYVTSIGVFDINEYAEPNNYEDIVLLRHKIHQFRYRDFDKYINHIDDKMGRSRNVLKPHIDICIKYNMVEDKSILMGSNVYQYHFEEAQDKNTVNLMQSIIRGIEHMPFYPPASFIIKKSESKVVYRWEPYCYTDIVKNSKITNQRAIDRILLAFDDLCSIKEFFEDTIYVDEYLKKAPYLLFYFCKMVAIFLDETFDNLEKYTKHSDNENDNYVLTPILEIVNDEVREYCRVMRNNLHYGKQEKINLGSVDKMYDMLLLELKITNSLIDELRTVININPSKLRLMIYRFLRWVQMPI